METKGKTINHSSNRNTETKVEIMEKGRNKGNKGRNNQPQNSVWWPGAGGDNSANSPSSTS